MAFQVKADFSEKSGGKIRPLHGLNNGPKVKVFTYDMTPQYKELGIPFVRLHDAEYPYGSGEFVDIHCIFKNFDADETKEENYNFALTDEYVKAIVEAGGEPLYRLGESIEHAPVKRYIYPPKDFAKWARIAEHIIRHYCYGWANGFRYRIRYWEIFAEPDGSRRNPDYNSTWIGSRELFFDFYITVARHLKKCFPELKIGGCGWASAYNEFTMEFMPYLKAQEEPVPLDFYSWHRYYSKPEFFLRQAAEAEKMIREYYPECESVMDEWNYMEDWDDQPASYIALKDHRGASICAATLAALQTRTNIALAAYFEGDVTKEWSGLWSVHEMSIGNHGRKASVKPEKPFYAFKAFSELYKLGEEVTVTTEGEELYAVAAEKDGKFGILIANPEKAAKKVELRLEHIPEGRIYAYTTDEMLKNEIVGDYVPDVLKMRENSFTYITNVKE